MKKTITTLSLCLLALTASAENRSWDFTNWSQETLTNLAADAASIADPTASTTPWRTWEKNGGPTTDNPDKGGAAYWWGTDLTRAELTANGTTIKETAGLLFTVSAGNLALCINYPSTTLGDYAGGAYLWMGGSSKSFTIPDVKPGAKITMEVESHKTTDGRGVGLTVGGTAVSPAVGSETPTKKTTCVWYMPTVNSEEETVDAVFTNNSGCHIYSITVEEDAATTVENAKIAYVFDSSYSGYSADMDYARTLLGAGLERLVNVTTDYLDVSGDLSAVSADSLTKYTVVVVSGAYNTSNAYTQTLKEAIAYVPMLNLNANLYAAWGYGETAETQSASVTVAANYINNDLFKPSSISTPDYVQDDGTLSLYQSGTVVGVSLPEGSYFANDRILATSGETVAMHMHNASRNAYLFMPYPYGNYMPEDNLTDLFVNALAQLSYSKADIPQAAAPTITQSYKNLQTDISLSSATSGATIYFTTGGDDPSQASTLYTGPLLNQTAGVIVKAIAYADGYSASEISCDTVETFVTSTPPTISVTQSDGKANVTITSNEEGATLYYNFTGVNDTVQSTVYDNTTGLTLSHNTTLYAFAGPVSGKIVSEVVSQFVEIEGKQTRLTEVAHFDANKADWSMGESKVKYYNSRNGYNYYEITDSQTVKASDGITDSLVYVYTPADSLYVVNPGNGWELKTYGQSILWELINVVTDIDKNNETARYRGETAFDQGASKDAIKMHNVQKSDGVNNDPYSASLQSTVAFQAPFDIVVYVGNASSNNIPKADIWVSNDTTNADNWQRVDSVTFASKQRWLKKSVLSYEGTDQVFVKFQAQFSSIHLYDIYIMTAGDPTTVKNVEDKTAAESPVVNTVYHNFGGSQVGGLRKGVNLISEIHADGSITTRKVVISK